jgi:putative FmdB family regulatory protein
MPTYDYRCDACGHEFELFQSMSAPVKRKCPDCGKLRLRRLMGTGAGVIFKGSGFYQTDYRSDSYKKSAEAEKKSAEKKPADTRPADAGKKSPPTKSADSGTA